eukprot:CAMPEP_0196739718 /NCGR_PEP_ID=MMETSP1091-20130531/24854_1 /TAXON_ID=302021 /ORGANISM="Rhodomonas sp., Strain CCMP768" /LENGTH=73 /DNA_ID=CAMNT_0042084431 /DNA_START=581 /DNA_END=799 /DNA_ORIENTATION=-
MQPALTQECAQAIARTALLVLRGATGAQTDISVTANIKLLTHHNFEMETIQRIASVQVQQHLLVAGRGSTSLE